MRRSGLRGEEGWQWQKVAGARRAIRDQREYFGDQPLLYTCFLSVLASKCVLGRGIGANQLSVELRQPRLPSVVEDKYGVNHLDQAQK